MAKANSVRNCQRCGKAVRQDGDYVKACKWTTSAVFHFQCFLALMHEQSQITARQLVRESQAQQA